MKTFVRLFRLGGIILTGLIGLGFVPNSSLATVITDCPGGICSLQDMLNGSTITINDKKFDSWQLFNAATSLATPPNYSLIDVNPIDDPLNPGLRYSTNGQMSITNGLAGDLSIPCREGNPPYFWVENEGRHYADSTASPTRHGG